MVEMSRDEAVAMLADAVDRPPMMVASLVDEHGVEVVVAAVAAYRRAAAKKTVNNPWRYVQSVADRTNPAAQLAAEEKAAEKAELQAEKALKRLEARVKRVEHLRRRLRNEGGHGTPVEPEHLVGPPCAVGDELRKWYQAHEAGLPAESVGRFLTAAMDAYRRMVGLYGPDNPLVTRAARVIRSCRLDVPVVGEPTPLTADEGRELIDDHGDYLRGLLGEGAAS